MLKKKSTKRSFENGKSIVVIGASMGGLQAVSKIVSKLPNGYGLPVVIALHRNEESKKLSECIQEYTRLPVVEPDDKDPILPGRVYIAPAGYHLMVERMFFELSTEGRVLYARPAIDVLFGSAADHFREGTIGVILTGGNADGARGLKQIKKKGGLTIVQDPNTAKMKIMPAAAIEACRVDLIMPLKEIAQFLSGITCSNSAVSGEVCN